MRYAAKSDKGIVRDVNEDYYKVIMGNSGLPPVFIIADGMGGHNSGEIASKMAVESAAKYILENIEFITSEETVCEVIVKAMDQANSYVYTKSQEQQDNFGMGTTLIIAVAYNNKIHIAHIGDSRVYIIRNGRIERITTDHSYIEELIKNGSLTREEARNHPQKNLITRAIGCSENIQIDTYSCDICKNDSFVLCTDGLTNMLGDDEIMMVVEHSDSQENACNELVERANRNGGADNITAIIINNN